MTISNNTRQGGGKKDTGDAAACRWQAAPVEGSGTCHPASHQGQECSTAGYSGKKGKCFEITKLT